VQFGKLGKLEPKIDKRNLKLASIIPARLPEFPINFKCDDALGLTFPQKMFGNDRYGNCFTGDTKISLLNGVEITLKELSENYSDKEFWVYSLDDKKNIVPGLAHSPKLTRKGVEILEIKLDNNELIKCTPDHLFLLRNNTYREAKDLQINDSLMPLYRKLETHGYELCLNPRTGKYTNTHKLIIRSIEGKKSLIPHHKDGHKRNNEPTNLEYVTPKEHYQKHSDLMIGLTKYVKSEAGRKKSSEIMRKVLSDPIRKKEILRKKEEGFLKWVATGNKTGFALWDKEKLIKFTKNNKPKNFEVWNKNKHGLQVAWNKNLTKENNEILADMSKRYSGSGNPMYGKHSWNYGLTKEIDERVAKYGETRRKNSLVNHKVVSIKNVDCADVYDFEVEKYHNFALSAGIFVHNCVIAGRANHTYRFEGGEQKKVIDISDDDVISEYFKESGGADSGLYFLDSLKCWRNGWLAGGNQYSIYAFAQINQKNIEETKAAINWLNGAYVGIALPISAQSQLIWSVVEGPNSEPGSWGRHAVYIPWYIPGYMICCTWGVWIKMTNEFFLKYCDEAFAVVDNRDAFLENSPIDVEALDNYLHIITGGISMVTFDVVVSGQAQSGEKVFVTVKRPDNVQESVTGFTNSSGEVSIGYNPSQTGTFTAFAYIEADSQFLAAMSDIHTFIISPTQNPRTIILTITGAK